MKIGTGGIIHIFALLHVAVAVTCRLAGIADEILLTLLTVLMVTLICVRSRTRTEFLVSCIILTNVTGYFLGVYGAKAITLLIESSLLSHAISTMLTTEVLGWCTALLVKFTPENRTAKPDDSSNGSPLETGYIILVTGIIAVVIGIRILIKNIFTPELGFTLPEILFMLLSKTGLAVVMVSLLVLLVHHIRKRDWHISIKALVVLISCITLSGITVMIVRLNPPYGPVYDFGRTETFQIFFVCATVYLIFFSLIYTIYYTLRLNATVKEERGKATAAEFQYLRLKQQVDPHFLFNSLNILDCLVQDEKTDQASNFIHKLAGLYRYMLKYDDRMTVALSEEMKFVGMYTDLLKIRYEDGFTVLSDIPQELMSLQVIPCSVQMLIENAVKHNRTDADNPLEINISACANSLTVSNRINLRLKASESTKLGLDYLKRQYQSLYDKSIVVSSYGERFQVTIPLLKQPSE